MSNVTSQVEEEEWIESPGGWENSAAVATASNNDATKNNDDEVEEDETGFMKDMFSSGDPRDTFTFDLVKPCTINGDKDKTVTARIQLKGFTLESDETAQSTGVTLWQAAPRLATFLMEQRQSASSRNEPNAFVLSSLVKSKVLELGAGLGLCGIVAHHLGAQTVVMTDGDIHALKQMRENVKSNTCIDNNESDNNESDNNESDNNESNNNESNSKRLMECRQLIWGSKAHSELFRSTYGSFDVVLGADVIYTQESTEPLFDTVVELMKRSTTDNNGNTGCFILSRYNKWNNVSDEIVLDAAKARGLECVRPNEGIFIFSFPNEKSI